MPTADGAATLIVGPSWVGDMVMAQSLFRLAKAREPERQLDVLAPEWSLPVVARMPEIRQGIASETAHGELGIGKRWHIASELRARGYDRAIVMPRSFKSALIPWFAGIPKRTGFRGETRYFVLNDIRPFDRNVLDQTVKRFVALGLDEGEVLGDIPNPALQVSKENQRSVIERLGLRTDRPVIAMMPGAEYGPAKCWPLEKFASLARDLDEAGYEVWVLGSGKDGESGTFIAERSNAVNICGKTSLEDVIDLLGCAEQAVSNDSGLMHIAAAVGTWVQAIYGSSSPGFTPPLTRRQTTHYLALDCSPCFERHCPLEHLDCLRNITAEQVFDNIVLASDK
jgi:heptosyltransferase-2